jgi:WD40 repeat protein
VRVWDAETGTLIRTLREHEGEVKSVSFSGDGRLVASGSADRTVRVWHAETGKPLRTLRGHGSAVRSVSFSPDGRRLASGSEDGTIRVWDVLDGALLATLFATEEGWAAFTPDGRYKVAGNLGGSFWYAVGMVRYEPGELDEFVLGLTRVEEGERLW